MTYFILGVAFKAMLLNGLCAYQNNVGAPTERAVGVPVYEGSIDRPYRVVGEISDNLRKPFAFTPNPSREEILAEIWERGRKMGADAVINARFGPTKVTVWNHGRTPISGTAIKFTDQAD